MLPTEIVVFCFVNKRGFQNHANRYLRMLEHVWNEHQVNLTTEYDEEDEWNVVLTKEKYIVKFNKSTLEIQSSLNSNLRGDKYKFFIHGHEFFMIGEACFKVMGKRNTFRMNPPDNWVANLNTGTLK